MKARKNGTIESLERAIFLNLRQLENLELENIRNSGSYYDILKAEKINIRIGELKAENDQIRKQLSEAKK